MSDEYLTIRKTIQENGGPLYRMCCPPFQYLVGEIMSLNEEYCLNHPDTIGYQEIMRSGFTTNQKRWIEQLLEHG